MKIQSITDGKKVTIEDIEYFCQEKKIELPDDYVKFLLKTNGGEPEKTLFKWFDADNCICDGEVSNFIPLKYFKYDLYYHLDMYKGRIPRELLPIAEDGFGNLICICVEGEYQGNIYFWHHEFELDRIAFPVEHGDSFKIFLKKLRKQRIRKSEYEKELEFIDKLAENGTFSAIVNYLETATEPRKYDIADALIRKNKIKKLGKFLDKYGYQEGIISDAAIENNIQALQLLFEKGYFEKYKNNEAALSYAVKGNHYEAIEFLIKHGVDIYKEDYRGKIAADHGFERGDEKTKRILKELIHDEPFLKRLESDEYAPEFKPAPVFESGSDHLRSPKN